ncbi:hypothetical protein L6452_36729 [Arctium lappa]|uniref:Uncharacterized protein n=1 Tax=Arctium lappa TaxID=4217 RepID=A0ACB8YBH6_ARCLA|nr:hypothetical protein L6452_36729 [Arctium lappa]
MGDSLPFVEESMHRKTRKTRIPIHRVKFSDPNMNFRNIFMEKANVWLKRKRHESLLKRRAISSSRQSFLNDEEVLKISQMPSLPATDAVPFNEGWYDENEKEEGSIPFPSVTSNRGSKPSSDGTEKDIEEDMLRRKNESCCLEGFVQSKQGTASEQGLISNTFLGAKGHNSASTNVSGMNYDEHHASSYEDLLIQKEPPKIVYFGNMECLVNMEDSFTFFGKFNEGNSEVASLEKEEGLVADLEGSLVEKENFNCEVGDGMEIFKGDCEVHVDGFNLFGEGKNLIGKDCMHGAVMEGNMEDKERIDGVCATVLESNNCLHGNLENREIMESLEKESADHVQSLYDESGHLLDYIQHGNDKPTLLSNKLNILGAMEMDHNPPKNDSFQGPSPIQLTSGMHGPIFQDNGTRGVDFLQVKDGLFEKDTQNKKGPTILNSGPLLSSSGLPNFNFSRPQAMALDGQDGRVINSKPMSDVDLPSILGPPPRSPAHASSSNDRLKNQEKDINPELVKGKKQMKNQKSKSKAPPRTEYKPDHGSSSFFSPIHLVPSEPMDTAFEQDDLLDGEDVIEVDSDDGATARFLTRDLMSSQVDPVPTPEPERMDSTPSLVS